MPYTIEKLSDLECVSVVYSGRVTQKQHYESRDETNTILSETGWKKLMVDAANINAEMSLADDYQFTKEHPFALPIAIRMAILHHPDESERFGFIEDVARNRGANLKTFTDRAEALDWLMQD